MTVQLGVCKEFEFVWHCVAGLHDCSSLDYVKNREMRSSSPQAKSPIRVIVCSSTSVKCSIRTCLKHELSIARTNKQQKKSDMSYIFMFYICVILEIQILRK